jgi:adenine phosphoribosyltransferase
MEKDELAKEIFAILPDQTVGKYDLLTIFADQKLFAGIVKILASDFRGRVDYVAAPEAIGWILGSALAIELGVGFIGIRKNGKLPYRQDEIVSVCFTDYSGQEKSFEIVKDSVVSGKKVLIVDDWIEPGSQMAASIALLEKLSCQIVGLATIGIDTNDVTRKWLDSGCVSYIGSDK